MVFPRKVERLSNRESRLDEPLAVLEQFVRPMGKRGEFLIRCRLLFQVIEHVHSTIPLTRRVRRASERTSIEGLAARTAPNDARLSRLVRGEQRRQDDKRENE
jgi:hypothetical protein